EFHASALFHSARLRAPGEVCLPAQRPRARVARVRPVRWLPRKNREYVYRQTCLTTWYAVQSWPRPTVLVYIGSNLRFLRTSPLHWMGQWSVPPWHATAFHVVMRHGSPHCFLECLARHPLQHDSQNT